MQKKIKSNTSRESIIRTSIIVLISNILLLTILPYLEEQDNFQTVQSINPTEQEAYFKIEGHLKTKFESGQEVLIVDKKVGKIKVKLVQQLENDSISNDTKLETFLIIAPIESVSIIYQMKNPDILPLGLKIDLEKHKKRIGNYNYEINY